MKRAASLVLFLGLFHTFSASQDRALISGDVEDRQDTPIAGAQIVLRNDALRFERHTSTNADGLYFFAEVIPAEGYVIDVAAAGISFEPQRVKFDLEVGETRHILPSFVGVKMPAPTAKLQRGQRWDMGEQAVGGPLWANGATELAVSYYVDGVNPIVALVSDANPQSGVSASTAAFVHPAATRPVRRKSVDCAECLGDRRIRESADGQAFEFDQHGYYKQPAKKSAALQSQLFSGWATGFQHP
jgi:hypothetical protein